MKIEFGPDICQEFDHAIKKEWIETNSLGSYSSSTIYGLNTRRYHGLLVVPLKSFTNRVNILSKLEESVFIENRVYEISANQFNGGVYPDGYKFLKKFSTDPFPKFYYEVEDRKIEKTIIMLHNKNMLVVRYTLKNQKLPVKLVIKPIIAGRGASELSNDVKDGINTDSYMGENMITFAPKPTIPEFHIYYLKGEYIPATLWYNKFSYIMDNHSDQDSQKSNTEDLFNPGFFTHTMEPYDTFELYISLDKLSDFDYEKIYYQEKAYRDDVKRGFSNFPDFLRAIAQKTVLIRIPSSDKNITTLPSYHWGEYSVRESLLLMLGQILIEKDYIVIRNDIRYLLSLLQDGVFPISFPYAEDIHAYPSADSSLIFINLIFIVYKLIKNDLTFLEEIYDQLKTIIDSFKKGTRFNIYLDKDYLIHSGDKSTFTGWFPLTDKNGNVYRYGKLLEINALWYNALKIMEYFSHQLKKNRQIKKYEELANKTQYSFMNKFWNKKNHYCYDYIRGEIKDETFRINQIIPLALTFTMIDTKHGQLLLNRIEKELLTPYGLRTLSKKDENFVGQFNGLIDNRKDVYYNGAVWPWSIGVYIDAVIKYKGKKNQVIAELWKLIENYKEISRRAGMGYIPEIFEGNPPHRLNGSIAYSLSATELLRAYFILNRINVEAKKNE